MFILWEAQLKQIEMKRRNIQYTLKLSLLFIFHTLQGFSTEKEVRGYFLHHKHPYNLILSIYINTIPELHHMKHSRNGHTITVDNQKVFLFFAPLLPFLFSCCLALLFAAFSLALSPLSLSSWVFQRLFSSGSQVPLSLHSGSIVDSLFLK